MVKKSAQSASAGAAPRSGAPQFTQFNPAALAGNFTMPKFDADALATAQRRNVEAMTAVCQLAFDCVQQSAQRQAQIFRDTAEEMMGSFRQVGKIENPQEQANSQLAVGRHALERSMGSLRELAELIARTNAEAFEIINQRATSCLAELQDSAGSKSK